MTQINCEECNRTWEAISFVNGKIIFRCLYHWLIYYNNKKKVN